MARYTESVCRLCRRENLKLFLKGERCYTDKCAIERRNYPPGQHGQGRPKFSEYSIQLREKQKVSRAEARTLVRHGHVLVNGKKVNIPSYTVRAGDVVSVKEPSRQLGRVQSAMEGAQRRGVPDWAEVDRDTCSGKIKILPTRSDVTMPINEKLIVELYSK